MNIFEALTQGKGRINEETMSAMLGFLLNPAQTHGIGDTFLRLFLSLITEQVGQANSFKEILEQTHISADIFLEEKYRLDIKTRTVDIEIRLYLEELGNFKEKHRIIIENKIKRGAAQAEQLREEFLAVKNAIAEEDETVAITIIFLTLGIYPEFQEEFVNLNETLLGNHKKVWLYWHDTKDSSNNITSIIRQILESELRGKINPISEYVRHTLKAFAYYIESKNIPVNKRQSNEVGSLLEQVEVKLSDGVYILERYQSKSIRVFKKDIEEYVIAKPILRQINKEKNIGINLYSSSGEFKNTQNLGYEIIKAILNKDKS